MLSFLRDPIWQFIGAVFAFFAIFTSVYLYLLQRRRKCIASDLLTFAEVVTVGDALRGKIEILYDGTPVHNAHLCIARIYNYGNTPVTQSDYVEPLCVSFGQGATILSLEILEAEPRNLKPEFSVQSGRITFSPFLFNPGDSFILRALVAHPSTKPRFGMHARIIGVRRISARPLELSLFWRSAALSLLVGLGGAGLFIAIVPSLEKTSPAIALLVSLTILIPTALGSVAAYIPVSRERARRRIYEKKYLGNVPD